MNIKIIFCLLLLLSFYNANEVVDGLRNQLASSSASMPPDWQSYVMNLIGQAIADVGYYQAANYFSEIKRFNFPPEVEQRFNQIAYSQSASFQSFSFSIKRGTFQFEEFTGIGRNNNGFITIAFVKAIVEANSTKLFNCNQYASNPPLKNLCDQIWTQKAAQLTFTVEEIYKIEQTLKAYASQLALEKLNNPPQSFEQYQQQQQQYQKNILLYLYQDKNCSAITPSCGGQAPDNSCFFIECTLPPQLTQLCPNVIAQRQQQCAGFLASVPRTSDCFKCICTNYKQKRGQNILECL